MKLFIVTDLTFGTEELVIDKTPFKALKSYLIKKGIDRKPVQTEYSSVKYISYRVKQIKGHIKWFSLK